MTAWGYFVVSSIKILLTLRYLSILVMMSSFSGHVVLHLVQITRFVSFSCFKETLCRRIHQINDDDCQFLYETYEVIEKQRSKYNTTSITVDSDNKVLIKGWCEQNACNLTTISHCSIPLLWAEATNLPTVWDKSVKIIAQLLMTSEVVTNIVRLSFHVGKIINTFNNTFNNFYEFDIQ